MKFLALLLLLSAPCMSSRAQSPAGGATPAASPVKPEAPSGPLLRPAPDFSTWEVTFTYPDDSAKPAAGSAPAKPPPLGANLRPRKVVTTKTGRIVHEESTNLQNHLTEVWFDGPTQYQKQAGGSTWFQSNGLATDGRGTSNTYHPLPANGFRSLDWITLDTYAGMIPYGSSSRCLVFTPGGYQKLDLSASAKLDQRLAAVGTIVYIDADTRLPIAAKANGELRTYHFGSPPLEMQKLPADLADQIKKGQEGRARLEMPAPRPH